LSYILQVNSGNLDSFRHRVIRTTSFAAEKVGGACSHLGAIGPKVRGVLDPLALWLPRPWWSPKPCVWLVGQTHLRINYIDGKTPSKE